MQGHGQDGVGVRKHVRRAARDPTGQEAGQVGAVGVFQLEYQVARVLVVEAGGAGAAEGRAACQAG